MDPHLQDFGEEEGSSPFDLKVLVLYGLFRSKLWVVLLTSLGLAGGLIVGASAPNEYQSEARLRYVPGERDKLTDDDAAGIDGVDRRGAAPGITDEIMLLENPLIYQRVARELGASRILELPDPTDGDGPGTPLHVRLMHQLQGVLIGHRAKDVDDGSELARAAAWRRLKGSTTLATVRNAATIRVLVRAYTPEKAQEFCGVLVEAFQERHREVFSAQARVEDQRKKVEHARQQYQSLEGKWNQYKEDCGVFDYAHASEANRTAFQELQRKIDDAEGQRRRTSKHIDLSEARLLEIDEMVDVRFEAVVGPNPDYALLRKQQSDLRNRLVLLVEGSMAENKRIKERDQIELQLKEIQSELEGTEQTIVILPARTEPQANVEFTDLKMRLLELRGDLEGVVYELEYMREQLEKLGQERSRIAACKDTHFMHQQLVEQAGQEMKLHQEQLTKLEKLAESEMRGASALKPYWEPTLPMTKVGPSRSKPLLAGIAAGLMLGLGVAVLRQLLDRYLRYPETLEKSLGLKVLGVVPEVRSLRGLRGPRRTKGSDAA